MVIAIEGPPMSDKPAVEQLISEALVHWQSTVKRCVNRSHPGVAGRKKKEKFTMPLSDLLEAQALEAQNFSGRVGLSLDDDDDDDDNVEKDDAEQEQIEAGKAGASLEEPEATANSTATEQTREAHGPYCMQEGWALVSLPDSAAGQLEQFAKQKWWRNKRIAHIFDDGWYTGTYKANAAR